MDEDYEMFGLDKRTSTTKDAKKAYYNMSLLVHPDRNSCPDRKIGCQEMHTVIKAYHRVMASICSREENKIVKECKDLTKYHEEELRILDEKTKEMPSFMDIYIETHDDIQKFNKAWEQRSNEQKDDDYLLNSSTGYDVIESEYANISTENLVYNPNIECDLSENMIKFAKPKMDIISIDELTSFNSTNSCCFDYKEAHGTPEFLQDRIPPESIEKYNKQEDIEVAYEKKCKELEHIFI
tara:strand:- start:3533 stop:4249 length:717 start_codon:yes stop_codon:yes gene_type:complete